jgi:hypothetical protein
MPYGYEGTDDMTKRTQSTPYEVGYGKPPKATRFQKGRSGNPKGRTAGDENFIAVFKRLASKRVKISDGGTVTTMSMARAVIAQNIKAALNKDQAAMSNILRLAEHAGEFNDLTDPKVVGKPIFMPQKMETDEFIAFHGVEIVEIPSPNNR